MELKRRDFLKIIPLGVFLPGQLIDDDLRLLKQDKGKRLRPSQNTNVAIAINIPGMPNAHPGP